MDCMNFYIPDFFGFYRQNLEIIRLMKECPKLFQACRVAAIYGCFPGMIWNGGRINNRNTIDLEECKAIIDQFNIMGVALRFTCTNLLLEQRHLYDPYCNEILEYANRSGMNEILVATDRMEEYARRNFPNCKLISSTTKCIKDFGELEKELEKDYYLVVPDFSFNNTEQLYHISHPEKCEILLNDTCMMECTDRKTDYASLSYHNLGYKEEPNEFKLCPAGCRFNQYKKVSTFENIHQNPASVTAEALYTTYKEHGFRHAKIVGRGGDMVKCIEALAYYLALPEHRWEVFSRIWNGIL